jgi:hypothetical protein
VRYDVAMAEEMNDLFDQIAKLDKLTMTPILRLAGIDYDENRRYSSLHEESRRGAQFICHHSNDSLQGYIEFMQEETASVYVISIQIHPSSGKSAVLRTLLRAAHEHILSSRATSVRSCVHHMNSQSLRFHQKLGFMVHSQLDGKIHLRVDGPKISLALSKLCRRIDEIKTEPNQ